MCIQATILAYQIKIFQKIPLHAVIPWLNSTKWFKGGQDVEEEIESSCLHLLTSLEIGLNLFGKVNLMPEGFR